VAGEGEYCGGDVEHFGRAAPVRQFAHKEAADDAAKRVGADYDAHEQTVATEIFVHALPERWNYDGEVAPGQKGEEAHARVVELEAARELLLWLLCACVNEFIHFGCFFVRFLRFFCGHFRCDDELSLRH